MNVAGRNDVSSSAAVVEAAPLSAPMSASAAAVLSERHGSVVVLTLSNPPVNGLGLEMREALLDAVVRAQADDAIEANVLQGARRMFCGGADIRQFGTPKAIRAPNLREVNRTIETSSKPVVAAIHGVALGGGLELAMSCHWRIAVAPSRFALPEVKLGFVPGGGGTQRLPRLVGLAKATAMITSGETVDAEAALACGLIDRITVGDLLSDALDLAAEAIEIVRTSRITSSRHVDRLDGPNAAAVFSAARAAVASDDPNRQALLACISCVEASTQLQFDAGLDLERATTETLVVSEQSVRARRAFFASRAPAAPTPTTSPPTNAQDH